MVLAPSGAAAFQFRLSSAAEPLTVTLGTLAVLGAYVWLARYGLDLVDEGYFLDLATRVQHGQLPYRDFDTYYTPGIFYLNAAVLTLFGADALPVRVVMVGIRVACALLLYRLARRLTPPVFASVPALLLAATGGSRWIQSWLAGTVGHVAHARLDRPARGWRRAVVVGIGRRGRRAGVSLQAKCRRVRHPRCIGLPPAASTAAVRRATRVDPAPVCSRISRGDPELPETGAGWLARDYPLGAPRPDAAPAGVVDGARERPRATDRWFARTRRGRRLVGCRSLGWSHWRG